MYLIFFIFFNFKVFKYLLHNDNLCKLFYLGNRRRCSNLKQYSDFNRNKYIQLLDNDKNTERIISPILEEILLSGSSSAETSGSDSVSFLWTPPIERVTKENIKITESLQNNAIAYTVIGRQGEFASQLENATCYLSIKICIKI